MFRARYHSMTSVLLICIGCLSHYYCIISAQAVPAVITVCLKTPAAPYVFPVVLKEIDTRGPAEVEAIKDVLLLEWREKSHNSSSPFNEFLEDFTGFDVELLKAFSTTIFANSTIQVRVFGTYPELLYSVRTGSCDVALGGLIKTFDRQNGCDCPLVVDGTSPSEENVCCLDFPQHYHRDGVAVMMPAVKSPPIYVQVVKRLAREEIVMLFSVVALMLFVLGHVIWLVERGNEDTDFSKQYHLGINDGLWWGAVTMTTVGYGDRVPQTLCGRFIGFFWMFVGVAVSGIFIGLIAESLSDNSTYVLTDIKSMGQLRDVQICTVPGFFETFTSEHDLTYDPIIEENIDTCWENILSKRKFDEPGKKAVAEAVLSTQLSLVTDAWYIWKGGNPYNAHMVPMEISAPIQSLYASVAVTQGNPLGPALDSALKAMMDPKSVVLGSINNSGQEDFSKGLLGWRISDAKEQFFHIKAPNAAAVYLDNPPGGDNEGYSAATISIVVITGMLYLAVMVYLAVVVPLSSKFGSKEKEGVKEAPVKEPPFEESPLSFRFRGNRRGSYQDGSSRHNSFDLAELATLKARVQNMATEVSQLADIPLSISQLKLEIGELKQLLRESNTNGVS